VLAHLARVPGLSAHLLEAGVPYSREAFHQAVACVTRGTFIGKYSDAAAAVALAQAALVRAKSLVIAAAANGWASETPPPTISCRGVGIASAMRSEPERRGGDEVHCAVVSDAGLAVGSIAFRRGAWRRAAQEDTAALLALHMLWSDATGSPPASTSPFVVDELAAALDGGAGTAGASVGSSAAEAGAGGDAPLANVHWAQWPAPNAIAALISDGAGGDGASAHPPPRAWELVTHIVYPPGRHAAATTGCVNAPLGNALVLPGSFNPLHHGHLRCAAAAAAKAASLEGGSGRAVVFELSATNVDKPALAPDVISARVAQFHDHPVVVTRAPRFIEKATLFPGAWFVVGYDTAARLVQARYYDGHEGMVRALLRVAATGTRFIVAGRVDSAVSPPRFATLDDLTPSIPPALLSAGLFVGLSESEFREDVSSTQLRAVASGADGTVA